jgi:hypothetical protein
MELLLGSNDLSILTVGPMLSVCNPTVLDLSNLNRCWTDPGEGITLVKNVTRF